MRTAMWGCLGGVAMLASIAYAKGPEAQHDMNAALEKAKSDQKMLFVQFGREACGNCQALKSMIAQKQVRLSESDFVYADVNCDDPLQSKAFREHFKVEGRMLPFVVVAAADGTQLAARSGSGSASEFEALIKEAKKAVRKTDTTEEPKPKTSPVAKAKPVAVAIPHSDSREIRAWTSASGAQVQASLVEEQGAFLVLKKEDGTNVRIECRSLSKADQDYVASLKSRPDVADEAKDGTP